MTDLYLIAHRVRGEPAFDIACTLDQIDEDGDIVWIIPTSGHRAYPWWHIELASLSAVYLDSMREPLFDLPSMPEDLQDHYHLEQTVRTSGPNLLDRLNLRPIQPPIIRRI